MENAVANNGRTRDACHYCDPRFAGWFPNDGNGDDVPDNFEELRNRSTTPNWWTPWCRRPSDPSARPNLQQDEIYKGEQPVYDAVQAAKGFVSTIDPQFGQVGYVTYDSNIGGGRPRSELECLRKRDPETLDDPD